MKYCSHCGKEIANEAVVCPYCGCSVNAAADDTPSTGLNILAFLFPLIGLILFCVYNGNSPAKAKAIGKWALIGFIVEIVLTVIANGIGLAAFML